MKKLEHLSIESTDIDSGLEYLPKNIKSIDCRSDFPEKKCLEIEKILQIINKDLNKFEESFYKREKQIVMIAQITSQEIDKIEKISSPNLKDKKIRKISLNIKDIESFLPPFVER